MAFSDLADYTLFRSIRLEIERFVVDLERKFFL